MTTNKTTDNSGKKVEGKPDIMAHLMTFKDKAVEGGKMAADLAQEGAKKAKEAYDSDEGKQLRKDLETGVKSGWDFLKGKVSELKDTAAAATAKNEKAAASTDDKATDKKAKADTKKADKKAKADDK